ncbi:MAG: HD-GYP domain-containing protein [Gaiellaceae bacterium]
MSGRAEMVIQLGARVFVWATIAAGLTAVALAVLEQSGSRSSALALRAAAAIVTELLQVRDEDPFEGGSSFSFSSSVHLATILILGPWAGVLVAALGVLVADFLRGSQPHRVLFNASAFGLATLGGGTAFELAGGRAGALGLPHDLVAVAAMAVTYLAVNIVLVSAVVTLTAAMRFWPLLWHSARRGISSAAAEVGLGVTLAFFAFSNPWKILILAPLVLAVYQAHARLALLRQETAVALETFANVVDERDPYTYRHSARVAEHVARLATALDLPASDVSRLRWAGRLHDLGKIAVDSSILAKPTGLTAGEWEVMRRHPRLSARLLRRFRFASAASQAVEYHHERFDGTGYYGIAQGEIPLASHFLTVADTYDAMVSGRPYRAGLRPQEALAEIEAGAGRQFHPAVAKAFVAMQRGEDPLAALTVAERQELRGLGFRTARGQARVPRLIGDHPEALTVAGVALVLLAAGLGQLELEAAAALLALAGIAAGQVRARRRRGLVRAVRRALDEPRSAAKRFRSFVDRLAGATDLTWAGLVEWDAARLTAHVRQGVDVAGDGPATATLESWLLRDAVETSVSLLVAPGAELGRNGTYAAIPVLAGGRVVQYVVLGFAGPLPRYVELALGDIVDALPAALGAEQPASERVKPRLVAVS